MINKTSSIGIEQEFQKFILKNNHPCIMAKTVFKMNLVQYHVYKNMTSEATVQQLLKDIKEYVSNYDFTTNDFVTFLAVFEEEEYASEKEFENDLWQLLQQVHNEDRTPWDPSVNSDCSKDDFSFSIAGKAFYVVGMHPNSSRIARQSPLPAIAFNLHWQFEKLREMGVYYTVRDKIRKRDKKNQGSINPMLEDFGHASEAKQYSGRQVESDWKCPFHPKP